MGRIRGGGCISTSSLRSFGLFVHYPVITRGSCLVPLIMKAQFTPPAHFDHYPLKGYLSMALMGSKCDTRHFLCTILAST